MSDSRKMTTKDEKHKEIANPQPTLLDGLIIAINARLPHAKSVVSLLQQMKPLLEKDAFREFDEANKYYPIKREPIENDEAAEDFFAKEMQEGRRLNLNRKYPERPALFIQNIFLALKVADHKPLVKDLLREFAEDGNAEDLLNGMSELAIESKKFLSVVNVGAIKKWEEYGMAAVKAEAIQGDAKIAGEINLHLNKQWQIIMNQRGFKFFDVPLNSSMSGVDYTFKNLFASYREQYKGIVSIVKDILDIRNKNPNTKHKAVLNKIDEVMLANVRSFPQKTSDIIKGNITQVLRQSKMDVLDDQQLIDSFNAVIDKYDALAKADKAKPNSSGAALK